MKIIFLLILISLQLIYVYSSDLCPQPFNNVTCPVLGEIKYYLYTKSRLFTEIYIGKLADLVYNLGSKFIFITHGFNNDGFTQWILTMIDAFFAMDSFNIIVVDWSQISAAMNYFNVVIDTNRVYPFAALSTCCSGENMAKLVIDLYETLRIDYANMLFIGHSLGAHFLGCAGQYVLNKTGYQIGQIVGMDPAGPLFIDIPSCCRLSSGDAIFVYVIHTDMDILGYPEALGDLDMYPNGGATQPGCHALDGKYDLSCDHSRVYELYTDSISKNHTMIASKCSSYSRYELGDCLKTPEILLGYYVDEKASGQYYLDTKHCSPFGMNTTRHISISKDNQNA